MNAPRMPGKILVTGASGLLGTEVIKRLSDTTSIIPLAHNINLPGTEQVDLLAPDTINKLDEREWDAVVHCAAIRSPDICEENREKAYQLNTEVSANIARLAERRDARMIHISTDYVFPGESPPYLEDSPTRPVNYYGETKLAAEQKVGEIYPGAVILRIPALYGEPPPPVTSSMLDEGIEAALSDQPSVHDNITIRYPTYTGDIANVIAFLLQSDFTGTIQATAPEKATRYEWAISIANILGRDTSHIGIRKDGTGKKAVRPVNSKLSTKKLEELGAPLPRGYSEILPGLTRIRNIAGAT